jgi:hypothetical protein
MYLTIGQLFIQWTAIQWIKLVVQKQRQIITENQDGVDEATGKLTQILHSISDKACKTLHKSGRKKKKKFKVFTQSKIFLF